MPNFRQLPVVWIAALVCIAALQPASPQSLNRVSPAPSCATSEFPSPPDLPVLSSPKPRVLILGSSTAEGYNASQYPLSWAGRLTLALRSVGIDVVNASISGTNTANSLQRFDRDVTPRQPSFVILSTSILNENFISDPSGALNRYLTNLRLLVERVRALPAVPVVITMYPSDRYGGAHIELLRQVDRRIEELGVPLLHFGANVSDEQGRWLPGMSGDGVHPTDLGHEMLFDSIPITLFGSLLNPVIAPPLNES